MRVLICAAALFTSACAQPASPGKAVPIPVTRLQPQFRSFITFSAYDAAATEVVRDRDAWMRAWNQLHARMSPLPALPDIDFGQEMIVVVALGPKPSSGYEVVITGASESDGTITVEADSRSPASNCVTLTVLTSPGDIARLPRRTGPVVVHFRPITVPCG